MLHGTFGAEAVVDGVDMKFSRSMKMQVNNIKSVRWIKIQL
jgi:hypothetical protein